MSTSKSVGPSIATFVVLAFVATGAYAEDIVVPLNGVEYFSISAAAKYGIANEAVADVQLANATTLRILGRSAGSTTLVIEDRGGSQKHSVVVVARDLKDVIEQMKAQLTGLDFGSDLAYKVAGNKVVVQGRVLTQDDKLKYDRVRSSYPEVVDMTEVVAKELLVDINVSLVEVAADNSISAGLLEVEPSLTADLTGTKVSIPLDSMKLSFNLTTTLNKLINGMVDNNQAKIIARPRIVTINGKEARLSAGGEIPYTVPTINGPATEYKSYGIMLTVTPTWRKSSNEVLMSLNIESSEPEGKATRDVALTSRKAHLEVAVERGKSLVIAGMFKTTMSGGTAVGCLFPLFQTSNTANRREILIVVTPNVLTPDNKGLNYDDFKMIKEEDTKK
jgi:Flp pilus assembly secretin CpaC